jgi:hypothetical protein
MASVFRTIIEAGEAAAELDRLSQLYPRFSDWWEYGWKWRLSRDPVTEAIRMQGVAPPTYQIKTSPNHKLYGIPFTLTLMYRIDDNSVEILAVRVVQL